jgi:5'-3' exonuclease
MTSCLFDGNSLFARGWYAALGNNQKDANGQPVSGIVASLWILTTLFDARGRLGVIDRTLFCWDTAQKKDKKRTPKPPEYDAERYRFIDLLTQLFNSAHAVPPAHEADDCVATYVHRADPSEHLIVVSGDKDLQSLSGQNVSYYSLNEKAILSNTFITHEWHVKKPAQIAIALAILGDPGDNVPGIKGWGPKKVQQLFEDIPEDLKFSEVLERIVRKIPEKHLDIFYESLDLTLLDPGVPDVPDPAPLVFGDAELVADELLMPDLSDVLLKLKTRYQRSTNGGVPISSDFDYSEN